MDVDRQISASTVCAVVKTELSRKVHIAMKLLVINWVITTEQSAVYKQSSAFTEACRRAAAPPNPQQPPEVICSNAPPHFPIGRCPGPVSSKDGKETVSLGWP